MQLAHGGTVELHLEFEKVAARCALPVEKSNSTANPDQHIRRSFKKAAVGFTVKVFPFVAS